MLPENVPLQRGGGVIIIGEKGILMHETYGKNPRLYPESLMEAATKVPQKYERVETDEAQGPAAPHELGEGLQGPGQGDLAVRVRLDAHRDDAARHRRAARPGRAGRFATTARPGKVTNVADANQYLQREYRKGWSL